MLRCSSASRCACSAPFEFNARRDEGAGIDQADVSNIERGAASPDVRHASGIQRIGRARLTKRRADASSDVIPRQRDGLVAGGTGQHKR